MSTVQTTDHSRRLTQDECRDRLASTDLGRLAVLSHDDIDIFPVNFLVWNELLYFRSGPGAKMIEITKAPRVAFEVEGTVSGRPWSVLVKGIAQRLSDDSEIEASGVHRLRPTDKSEKWNYVRITPHAMTGFEFVAEIQTSSSQTAELTAPPSRPH